MYTLEPNIIWLKEGKEGQRKGRQRKNWKWENGSKKKENRGRKN